MPAVANLALLNRLDRLIAKYRLHAGDPLLPVDPSPLIEWATFYYGLLPERALAYTVRWRSRRLGAFTDLALDAKLKHPEWTAKRRHALAHEFGHAFCKHNGDFFIMWEQVEEPTSFDLFVDSVQEGQCEAVSAYVLVRVDALRAMKDEEPEHVAGVLDVPVHLVSLRWEMYQKFAR